jgi:hypothetical protein
MGLCYTDPVVECLHGLHLALATDHTNDESSWADDVYTALGQVADAIQDEVHEAEQTLDAVAELNPDFQNMPGTERHVDESRTRMIQLAEKIHQLRADIRQGLATATLALPAWQQRSLEIGAAIEKLRRQDTKFVLDTLNTNPGAGE